MSIVYPHGGMPATINEINQILQERAAEAAENADGESILLYCEGRSEPLGGTMAEIGIATCPYCLDANVRAGVMNPEAAARVQGTIEEDPTLAVSHGGRPAFYHQCRVAGHAVTLYADTDDITAAQKKAEAEAVLAQ